MKKLLVVLAACGGGGQSPEPMVDAPPVCGTPRTVFLNRGGGTYVQGAENSSTNTSSIIDMERTVAPPNVVEADWTFFVGCMTEKFAPFNVVITDQDPGAIEHTELVVIDAPGDVGLQNGVVSVSPFNCEVVPRAIPFLV